MIIWIVCRLRPSDTKGTECASVFLGGGTPSYLEADQLKRLFKIVEENFSVRPDAEYTIEANPESLDAAKLEALRSRGINRISLGVQSFHPHYLKYLGRNHDQLKARDTYHAIRDAGFTNVSLDLMFGFPKQTFEEIEQDVGMLTALKSDHVSLYMLNLEENSRFYAQKYSFPTMICRRSSTRLFWPGLSAPDTGNMRSAILPNRARNPGTISTIGRAANISALAWARILTKMEIFSGTFRG